MRNNLRGRRLTLTALAVLACLSVGLNRVWKASASTDAVAVIVELRGDPAAVYKAKAQKSGQTVSDQALQSYRDQLKAAQDQFLAHVQSAGIGAQLR
ncbi:MAG: hypothetical protein M3268_08855, partial [Acidobacteriota bacterium]|nr:hypothetical protein [Acidobacteriota bacterium]